MLSDLKVKTEGTSRSTACTISNNGKEIVSDEHTDSDIVSSVFAKKIFDNDLPEIKIFVENSKPMSFTKNWYPRPTPPDMQFEERVFQTQFSVFADKLYEWNINGLSEQEIINKMSHMSMIGIAYQNNHDLDQPKIVNLLVTSFSGTLHGWWDSYLSKESRDSIRHAVKKNDEGLPIFYESIGRGILDGVNTLIYIISKHFAVVFISRVMLRKDYHKPYWKEKFIDGLPPIFAHKVKQVLISKNDSIDYDNLTYGDIYIYIYIYLYIILA